MTKRAFTLAELMVGLVIGLLLTAAMITFTSSVIFDFHGQKEVVNDRSSLRQVMSVLAEDMVQLGYSSDADGMIKVSEILTVNFVTIEESKRSGDRLTYWLPSANLKDITSARPGPDLGWCKVIWEVRWLVDPVFEFSIPCLVRIVKDKDGRELSYEPVLNHVRDFVVEVGSANGAFVSTSEKSIDYANINAIRVYINSSTPTSSTDQANSSVEQKSTQTYFLKSRIL